TLLRGRRRQPERNLLMMRVHQHKEVLVLDSLSPLINLIHRLTGEKHTQRSCEILLPLFVGHLSSLRMQPENVLDLSTFDPATLKEISAAENRMALSQRNHTLRECEQIAIDVRRVPVDPADFVILTIRVVIPLLTMTDRISRQHHGHALRQEKRCQKISFLPRTQRIYLRIIGWPLNPAIPAAIVVGSVSIVFSVGLIVLLVVADQVL